MVLACSGHGQVGQGRAGQGRADTVVMNKGRAGQGRAGRDKVCISKPQIIPQTGQGQQNADRQRNSKHAHLSSSPHTPIKSPSTVEGDSTKKQRWREEKG